MGIHLSLTNRPDEMRIMWTSALDRQSFVIYWTERNTTQKSYAYTRKYTASDMCGSPANSSGYMDPGFIHDVVLFNLKPNEKYWYYVGTELVMMFFSLRNILECFNLKRGKSFENSQFQTSMIFFGDLSTDKKSGPYQTISGIDSLKDDNLKPDIIVHVGDISYARGKVQKD
ncbi:putative inactive purple acid phosphatase 27 [Thelohanellus kitauei]|uniref:Putative inactive purple acid phosphatase 27 n=1 Tax=Thelohanellus kitauei TaxID=669202 RepID=A0A0C2J9F0_THEKT|nr:putative inactive purple acid phosphatase 27 [Thelohanellus kitauei]